MLTTTESDATSSSSSSAAASEIATLIRGRRTIHDFAPEAPPAGLIAEALEDARWAPNHHLTQPWRFYHVGPETREQIARLNADLLAERKGIAAGEEKYQRWNAIPGWLVVTCQLDDDEIRAREDFAATCCVVHNLSLLLWSRGIGMKWTTGPVTRTEEFHELLWIDPRVETVVGLLWYGYAQEIPVTTRRPAGEVLVSLP